LPTMLRPNEVQTVSKEDKAIKECSAERIIPWNQCHGRECWVNPLELVSLWEAVWY